MGYYLPGCLGVCVACLSEAHAFGGARVGVFAYGLATNPFSWVGHRHGHGAGVDASSLGWAGVGVGVFAETFAEYADEGWGWRGLVLDGGQVCWGWLGQHGLAESVVQVFVAVLQGEGIYMKLLVQQLIHPCVILCVQTIFKSGGCGGGHFWLVACLGMGYSMHSFSPTKSISIFFLIGENRLGIKI